MTNPTLVAELAAIVRAHAQVPPEVEIAPPTRLADDLGIDSFGLVCVIYAVRAQYDLAADPDLDAIASLADLAEFVARHRGPRTSAA